MITQTDVDKLIRYVRDDMHFSFGNIYTIDNQTLVVSGITGSPDHHQYLDQLLEKQGFEKVEETRKITLDKDFDVMGYAIEDSYSSNHHYIRKLED